MDPVTAFGLAAGVLQVVDISYKALSTCKEIYRDGSLAQNRDTEELTRVLAERTESLEKSVSSARPVTSESEAVIEVSKKCSKIAAELLSELSKLRRDPEDGRRQAISKGYRAIRRKKFVTEIQEKLEKYQKVLDTSILSKLDANAIQQSGELQNLDQNVKDLAHKLTQGFNTVEQLLANQTLEVQQHIDRRFNEQAHEEALQRAEQRFKDSLFFPEMFARQDDIPKSHEGTCRWIFGPNYAHSESETQNKSENDSDVGSDFEAESLAQSTRSQPWSNFMDWLENGEDAYWLSGKPGSGKSTLMKYVSTELRRFHRWEVISHCGNDKDLVICSFFFWNIGSPLQKNYVGFLRSLLFQIAEQRGDLVPIMMNYEMTPRARTSESHEPGLMYAWTKERLDDALRRLLAKKPPLICVCMFIDGLDEFEGDEDSLMDIIRLLSRTSQIRVCVSSRPEQIFRQGFADSPQLRLQDLNKHDIQQVTTTQLGTVLKKAFPQLQQEITDLVNDVISRSQGIFLWVDLIVKDLQRGLRNKDNMLELRERLDGMPDTVHGVYEHMLKRLDKPYRRQAAKYFQFLMAVQEPLTGVSRFRQDFSRLTLLHFACAEEEVCEYNLSHDRIHFQSLDFQESCRSLETRILTRCAGLVEIDEFRMPYLEGLDNRDHERIKVSRREGNVSRYLREVRFIHKTVVEFLRSHANFFQDPNWQASAMLAVTRSQIRVASLTPITITREESVSRPITLSRYFVRGIMYNPLIQAVWPAQEDGRERSVTAADQLYHLWDYVTLSHDEPEGSFSETYGRCDFIYTGNRYFPQLRSRLAFATFFGCYDYVSQHVAVYAGSQKELDYLLSCAVIGIQNISGFPIEPCDQNVDLFVNLLKIVLELLPRTSDPNMYIEVDTQRHYWDFSKWSCFIQETFWIAAASIWSRKWSQSPTAQRFPQLSGLYMDVLRSFLDHNPDVNVCGLSAGFLGNSSRAQEYCVIVVEETLMAWITRLMKSTRYHSMEEIEDLFRSRGGLERTSIRFVGNRSSDADLVWTDLTMDQSERLLKEIPRFVNLKYNPIFDVVFGGQLNKSRPVEPTVESEAIVNLVIGRLRAGFYDILD